MIQLVVGLNTDATEVVGIASFNPQDDAAEKWWLQIRDVTKDSPGFIPQGYQNVCDKRGSNRKTFANWCASVAFFVGVNQFDVCEDRSEDGYFFRNRKKTSFKASNHRPDWIRHLFHGADQTLITSRHVGKNWWQLPQTLDREQFSVDVAYIDPNSEPRSWKVVSNTELETFLSEILRLDLKMPTASTENKSTGDSNKKNSPPLEVPLGEYGRFLKRYRILMGMSFKDLESQLKTTAPKYFNQSNQYLPAQSNLKRFEAGIIDEHQDLANLEAIFELYGFGRLSEMPGLMAEWLSAKPVNDHCIMYDHFEDPGRDNRKAVASEYKAPQQRLNGLDCSVLKYHLDPCPIPDLKTLHSQTGGLNENEFSQVPHSQQHQHMGDELVYCIDGQVIIELANSGLRCGLRKGDLIHFNSDVPHSIWNFEGKAAELLVLRFFQSNRNGTRQDQIQAIEKLRQAVGDLLRPDTPQDSTEGAAAQNEDPLQEPELISTRQLKLARNLHQNVIKSLTVYQSENERIADSFNEFLIWWMELESWLHDRSMPSRDALGTRFDPKSSNIRDWVGLAGFVELLCRIDPNPETRSTVDRYAKLRALLQDRATELANLQNLDEIAEFSGSAEGRQSKDVKTAKHTKSLATATAKVFTEVDRLSKSANDVEQSLGTSIRGIPPQQEGPTFKIIQTLAELFQLPQELFLSYMAPPVLRCIVIRQDDSDWIHTGKKAVDGDSTAVSYEIPSRGLANSDISINRLTLPPRTSSEWNWHAGFEMAYVIEGAITAEFQRAQGTAFLPQQCSTGNVLILRSQITHRLVNYGNIAAQVILIRFNVLDSLLPQSTAT